MRPELRDLFARAEAWPEVLQEAAIESLLVIEEEHAGKYHLSDDEWAAIQEGIAQADRGDFVPEETVAQSEKRLKR